MQIQDNYITLIATIAKLADKLQEQQYISSLQVNDEDITFIYKDGFKQKIPFSRNNNTVAIDSNLILEELKSVFNKILEAKFTEILQNLQDHLSKKLKTFIPALKDGVDGRDGRDADEQKIIKELEKTIAIKLEAGLLYIKQSMPDTIIPKDGIDGRDADEEGIKKVLLDYLKIEIDKIQHELSASIDRSIGAIPIPKDGVDGKDGKDADEKAIKDALFLELSNQIAVFQTLFDNKITEDLQKIVESMPIPKDGKDGKDGVNADDQAIIDIILPKLYTISKESTEDIKQKLLKVLIAKIEEITATLQPLQGERGEDGRDADDEKITREVLAIVSQDAKKSQALLQKELELGLKDIKSSIPIPKDGIDGKDGDSIKGEKGDRGNGIKDAEVDSSGHLIIRTDDRTIDAGEVVIKRYFGGGGGGSNFFYTNELPMPFDVGQVKAGTRFKNVDLRVLFTKLFYGFDFPEFDKFNAQDSSAKDIGGVFEIGYKIPAGDYNFDFHIINPELLEANSIFIEQDGQLLIGKLDNISPVIVSLNEITRNTIGKVNFRISAYDTTGVTFQKDYSCEFKHRVYYGEYTDDITDGALPSYTKDLFKVLRATELVSDIVGEYFFKDVGFKWFCYPEILGENYIIYDIASEIVIALNEPLVLTIINEYGLEIKYNCVRTTNELLNEMIIGIKKG